ncbi:MAG TPA: imidazole glycerol phosphate synthase subunit HisH [Chthonomonadaceae bacterium]|nr:imidazole glycerol phosphate synthase subunit HisH [Chthonomonadaceae bacterium]
MIAIIDYGMANLRSVERALAHAGGSPVITSDPEEIRRAERVVLPGVGAFCACMSNLNARGLNDAVLEAIGEGKPFLGICVGLQMLFDSSTEMGTTPGLAILPGKVVRFFEQDAASNRHPGNAGQSTIGIRQSETITSHKPQATSHKPQTSCQLPANLKVPHIGWNALEFPRRTNLFRDVEHQARVYFVHSYYPVPSDPSVIAAVSDYGEVFCAAVERENVAATQFHPEKSGAVGQRILRNFLDWKP